MSLESQNQTANAQQKLTPWLLVRTIDPFRRSSAEGTAIPADERGPLRGGPAPSMAASAFAFGTAGAAAFAAEAASDFPGGAGSAGTPVALNH